MTFVLYGDLFADGVTRDEFELVLRDLGYRIFRRLDDSDGSKRSCWRALVEDDDFADGLSYTAYEARHDEILKELQKKRRGAVLSSQWIGADDIPFEATFTTEEGVCER